MRADGRGDELREDDKVYGDVPRQHSVGEIKILVPCLVWVNILEGNGGNRVTRLSYSVPLLMNEQRKA